MSIVVTLILAGGFSIFESMPTDIRAALVRASDMDNAAKGRRLLAMVELDMSVEQVGSIFGESIYPVIYGRINFEEPFVWRSTKYNVRIAFDLANDFAKNWTVIKKRPLDEAR